MSAISAVELNQHFTFTLPPAAYRALAFASSDESRTALRGLRVEAKQGDSFAFAVATDGHRLCAVRFALEDAAPDDIAVTLAPEAVAQVVKFKPPVLRVTVLERRQTAVLEAYGKGEVCSTTDAQLVEADFPQWTQVLTAPARKALGMDGAAIVPTATCKDAVGVNLQYLADFAAYLAKLGVGKNNRGVTLHAREDKESPFTLTFHNVSEALVAVYIVMPMRV